MIGCPVSRRRIKGSRHRTERGSEKEQRLPAAMLADVGERGRWPQHFLLLYISVIQVDVAWAPTPDVPTCSKQLEWSPSVISSSYWLQLCIPPDTL